MAHNQIREPWAREFLEALGYLVVQAGYLEDYLVDIYGLVANLEWQELITKVRDMTLGRLLPLVLETLRETVKDESILARIAELEPRLVKAVSLRNEYIHAWWSFNPARERMERSRRQKIDRIVLVNGKQRKERLAREVVRSVTAADVIAATELIASAGSDFYDLHDEIGASAPDGPRGGFVFRDE